MASYPLPLCLVDWLRNNLCLMLIQSLSNTCQWGLYGEKERIEFHIYKVLQSGTRSSRDKSLQIIQFLWRTTAIAPRAAFALAPRSGAEGPATPASPWDTSPRDTRVAPDKERRLHALLGSLEYIFNYIL